MSSSDSQSEPQSEPLSEPQSDPPSEPPSEPQSEPSEPPSEPPSESQSEPSEPPSEPSEPPSEPPNEPPSDPPSEPPSDPPSEPPSEELKLKRVHETIFATIILNKSFLDEKIRDAVLFCIRGLHYKIIDIRNNTIIIVLLLFKNKKRYSISITIIGMGFFHTIQEVSATVYSIIYSIINARDTTSNQRHLVSFLCGENQPHEKISKAGVSTITRFYVKNNFIDVNIQCHITDLGYIQLEIKPRTMLPPH
jgi:hypothetical protein